MSSKRPIPSSDVKLPCENITPNDLTSCLAAALMVSLPSLQVAHWSYYCSDEYFSCHHHSKAIESQVSSSTFVQVKKMNLSKIVTTRLVQLKENSRRLQALTEPTKYQYSG